MQRKENRLPCDCSDAIGLMLAWSQLTKNQHFSTLNFSQFHVCVYVYCTLLCIRVCVKTKCIWGAHGPNCFLKQTI